MISKTLSLLQRSLGYVKNHPQILFVFLLLVVIPLLFLYSGSQFLEVGRANQDRLQKDRMGLMQDVFVSLMRASNYDAEVLQSEITKISAINPDIVEFRITKDTPDGIVPIAALADEYIGTVEESDEFYRRSLIHKDESIIFPFVLAEGRVWLVYRAVSTEVGDTYFVYTQFSLAKIDAQFEAKEREVFWLLGFVYVFFIGLTVWLIRITDYRYLYLEIKKTNKTKDLFMNMIAHELRAPLTAIRGYASMVEEANKNDEDVKYALRIRESAERLITIVNDLLDVARIQSGKLAVEREKVNVSDIIVGVVDELRVSGSEKNIELIHTGTKTPHVVEGDAKRLYQAMTNLVSNSIKYTKEGSIVISVEDKNDDIEIRVKDTGMGISSEDQKKLFAPFFRVEREDVSHITGSGLGMWITKQLIELMGAQISVESIKGVGTHIVVTLHKVHESDT